MTRWPVAPFEVNIEPSCGLRRSPQAPYCGLRNKSQFLALGILSTTHPRSVTDNSLKSLANREPFGFRQTTAPAVTRDLPATLCLNTRFAASTASGSSGPLGFNQFQSSARRQLASMEMAACLLVWSRGLWLARAESPLRIPSEFRDGGHGAVRLHAGRLNYKK